jgi:hypothetical protein
MNAFWSRWVCAVAVCLLCGCGGEVPDPPIPSPSPVPTPSPSPLPSPGPATVSRLLSIQPAVQQTPVWCWATSAEMVFRYYGLPNANPFGNYQCGIVAAYFGGSCMFDCGLCQFPVGPMSNMHRVITGYGAFLRSNLIASRDLSATLVFRALSDQEIIEEIDAGRPIVVGIAPGGGFALPNASAHIAVIVGYDTSGGTMDVIVNDPYPFDLVTLQNPYVAAGGTRQQFGRFRISVRALTLNLQWANTIYRIQ